MDEINFLFEIMQDVNCPLYELGDEFSLNGRILTLPKGKTTCMTLAGLISDFISVSEELKQAGIQIEIENEINCRGESLGCSGRIRLGCRFDAPEDSIKRMSDAEISAVAYGLKKISMFSGLDEPCVREIVTLLKIKRFEAGESIVCPGDPGVNLFIIISGRVEVIGENGVEIAVLEKGDVFGEMSLISGEPIGNEVRVIEMVRVLFMEGKNFRRLLNRFPSLKLYFSRLLARRIARINDARSVQMEPIMSGTISEIPPSELFQILNMNDKTGTLYFENMSMGSGLVRFRDGKLISAEYGKKTGKDAFFDIMQERQGRFKFSQGIPEEYAFMEEVEDFMKILMEGLNKLDSKSGF